MAPSIAIAVRDWVDYAAAAEFLETGEGFDVGVESLLVSLVECSGVEPYLLVRFSEKPLRPGPIERLHQTIDQRAVTWLFDPGQFHIFLRNAAHQDRTEELNERTKAVQFVSLPDRMRTTAIFNLLEDAMYPPFGKGGRRVERLPDVQIAAGDVAGQRLVASAFGVTGGNPNGETVKTLFLQVDKEDVFQQVRARFQKIWGQSVADVFARHKLDFIVSTRHEIAHGASASEWSRSDLKENERFLRILARTLDDELRIHLNAIR